MFFNVRHILFRNLVQAGSLMLQTEWKKLWDIKINSAPVKQEPN